MFRFKGITQTEIIVTTLIGMATGVYIFRPYFETKRTKFLSDSKTTDKINDNRK